MVCVLIFVHQAANIFALHLDEQQTSSVEKKAPAPAHEKARQEIQLLEGQVANLTSLHHSGLSTVTKEQIVEKTEALKKKKIKLTRFMSHFNFF